MLLNYVSNFSKSIYILKNSCKRLPIIVVYLYIHHIPFIIRLFWQSLLYGGDTMNKEDENDMTTPPPAIENDQGLSFEEKLKQLTTPIQTIGIGENSDQICREVRGKE
jgi:hypothetical protein